MSKAHSAVEATCEKFQKLEASNRALVETLDRLLTILSRVSVAADESTGIDLAYAVDHARAILESEEK